MREAKLTLPELSEKKAKGERLAMVAVGEAMSAAWAERAGVDIIGVGDSLGMTLHGHQNTLQITVDQMIMHILAVRNGAPNTMTIASMPYGSYATEKKAVENAIKMMKESGVDALKLQLGKEGSNIIKAVADAGVPIMSHVGLLPHKVHLLGGFKMQGRTAEAAIEIIENAQAIEDHTALNNITNLNMRNFRFFNYGKRSSSPHNISNLNRLHILINVRHPNSIGRI